MDELKDRLSVISDPNHHEYGYHITKEELQGYQQASEDAVHLVTSWLRSNGIKGADVSDSSISFTSKVSTVNEMLNTKVYHSTFDGSATYLRARSYSVPESLSGHIDLIHPLSHFARPPRSKLQKRAMRQQTPPHHSGQGYQPCPNGVTPACLRALYNATALEVGAVAQTTAVRFGVVGFLDEWVHFSDYSKFVQMYMPDIHAANYNFSVVLVNNGTNPQEPANVAGLEASLDMEYAVALGYPTNITYYSMGGRGAKLDQDGNAIPATMSDNEPYLELLHYMLELGDDELPHVLSMSYADDEQTVTSPYASKVCDLFAQLAARGVSVFVASGDGGTRGTGQTQCYSNDGQRRPMFIPTFPASCPYVTAVGATGYTLPLEGARFSAGGFSNYFATPDWQRSAADEYVAAMNGSHSGFYNQSGRAIPDISAAGIGFAVHVGGDETSVMGTSASTPVVAALVALANEERLKAGKNSTGWLNPLLYTPKVREALLDVAAGTSQDCAYGGDVESGFVATKGYDCVVGLGSIGDFGDLVKALN